jgi:outer membrane immunogenic protein
MISRQNHAAMKKILLLSSAIVAAGPAFAADLPVKARPMAVVPYSWTGCHVGGHIGGAWDRSTYSDPGTLSPLLLGGTGIVQNFAKPGQSFTADSEARFLGGVQAGCDYQFASHWVIGFGGDVSWTNLSSVTNDPFFGGKNNQPMTLSTRTNEVATITGRIGYAWDRVLFYGKGGAAYAHDKYAVNNSAAINQAFLGCNNGVAGGSLVGCNLAGNADRWGWTAGVGLEWAFATNWSAMIEYDHYGFDTKTISMNVLNSSFAVTPANLNVRHDIDTVKVGINYRFWSAGPVVARY